MFILEKNSIYSSVFGISFERPFLSLICFIIEHAAGFVNLFLLSRSDPNLPFSRYHAGNRLTELRYADLRFSRDMIHKYLKKNYGLDLKGSDIDLLDEKMDGWITAVKLLGISLNGNPDPEKYIESLKGGHRYIMDYLTEEVLLKQKEKVQEFLFSTSKMTCIFLIPQVQLG